MQYLADDSIQARVKREIEIHNKMRDQRQDIDKNMSEHLGNMWLMITKHLIDLKLLTLCVHVPEHEHESYLPSDHFRFIRMGLTERKGRCKICKGVIYDVSGMGLFSERELNLISAFAQTLVPANSCLFD